MHRSKTQFNLWFKQTRQSVCTDFYHKVQDEQLSWQDKDVNSKGQSGQVGRNKCIFWRGILAKHKGHVATFFSGHSENEGLKKMSIVYSYLFNFNDTYHYLSFLRSFKMEF